MAGDSAMVRGNKVEGGASEGAIIVAESFVTVKKNQIVDVAGYGIKIASGLGGALIGNEVLGAGDEGIECEFGGLNEIRNNLIKRSADGIDLDEGCDSNTVKNNRIKNVRDDGIELQSSSNKVRGNIIRKAAAVGVLAHGEANEISGNSVRNSNDGDFADGTGLNIYGSNDYDTVFPGGFCPENPSEPAPCD